MIQLKDNGFKIFLNFKYFLHKTYSSIYIENQVEKMYFLSKESCLKQTFISILI
jgi:hypothetical protein